MSSISPLGSAPAPSPPAGASVGVATPVHAQPGAQVIRDFNSGSAGSTDGTHSSAYCDDETPAEVTQLNIRLRLIGMGRDDSAARRRAFAMYLSHRLVKLLQQPVAPEQMDSLAEKVVTQMENDPDLYASIQEVGGQMLNNAA